MRQLPRAVRSLIIIVAAILLSGSARADRTEVFSSPHDVEPLQPGDHVPTVAVETIRGRLVNLADLVRESGALLVFYRGGW
jgi:hypothetical protein